MRRLQPITQPTQSNSEPGKKDPVAAVAMLARLTARYQGASQADQEKAAASAVSLLKKGVPAVNAIQESVKMAMQPHSIASPQNAIHDMRTQSCVFIVDDDDAVRDSLRLVIENAGHACQSFESAEHFLQVYCPGMAGCLLLDMNMPGMNGDELQAELIRRGSCLPIIFLTAHGDIPMTVRAIKAGAVDFLTKPIPSRLLLERIKAVLSHESR